MEKQFARYQKYGLDKFRKTQKVRERKV